MIKELPLLTQVIRRLSNIEIVNASFAAYQVGRCHARGARRDQSIMPPLVAQDA